MKQILMPNMPKGKINKKLIAIIALITFTASSLLWYFAYYTKTPTYSLITIKEAIDKHDLAKFNKHVDLDNSLSRGYDDLTSAVLETDKSLTTQQKAFAGGFIQMFKPAIVASLKDGIIRYVETGSWEDKKPDAPKKQAQKLDPEKIAENTAIKTSTFQGVEYTKKDGKTAILGVKIHEKETGKDFIIDIKMRQLEDGTWQIAEFSNLKQYIIELTKAKEATAKK